MAGADQSRRKVGEKHSLLTPGLIGSDLAHCHCEGAYTRSKSETRLAQVFFIKRGSMSLHRYQSCVRCQFGRMDVFLFRRWYKTPVGNTSGELVLQLPFALVYWRKG